MDEFKKAHKKMFKNGFIENEYQHQMTDDESSVPQVKLVNNEVSQ